MNIGVIGLREAWSTESLSESLRRKDAGGKIIELHEIGYDLDCLRFRHPDYNLDSFDGFILKKMGPVYSPHLLDELELLQLMERRGFAFFSKPSKISAMISRLSCSIHLRENGIPMPPTLITADLDNALEWTLDNLPVILKPLYSTKARGMELLDRPATVRQQLEAFQGRGEKIFYLQRKYDLAGIDYGLVFLGDDFLGAYARVSGGAAWHTTTREGGRYAAYDPPQSIIDLARNAQRPFGLDFTCVDVADTREAGPIVFEVSAFGGYKGLYQSTGLDASDLLTDYVIESLASGSPVVIE